MRKFGIETVSLSKSGAFNAATDNLGPGKTSGALSGGKGLVLQKGQFQELTYQLNAPRTVNVSLAFQVLGGAEGLVLSILVNGNAIESGYKPRVTTPMVKNWIVNSSHLNTGSNSIKVLVGGLANASLLLTEVKIGNFQIRIQRQTNWCWIATGLSVADYLSRMTDHGEQCKLYDSVKKVTGSCLCPERKAPEEMNRTGWPASPLAITKHLGNESRTPLPWERVLEETNANRPLICIINWKGGGRHAVVLSHAFEAGKGKYVVVDDPMSGVRSTISYDRLLRAYLQAGDEWTNTILCV